MTPRTAFPISGSSHVATAASPTLRGGSPGYRARQPSAGASRCVFRIKALASSGAIEIGTDDDDEGPENNTAVRWVDPQTGRIAAQQCDGAVATVECALNEDPDEKQWYLQRCAACGSRSGRYPEPVSPLHPGDEALSAVAAQVLLESLPEKEPDEFSASAWRPEAARILGQPSGRGVLRPIL